MTAKIPTQAMTRVNSAATSANQQRLRELGADARAAARRVDRKGLKDMFRFSGAAPAVR